MTSRETNTISEPRFDGREMAMVHDLLRREFALLPGLIAAVAPGDHRPGAEHRPITSRRWAPSPTPRSHIGKGSRDQQERILPGFHRGGRGSLACRRMLFTI